MKRKKLSKNIQRINKAIQIAEHVEKTKKTIGDVESLQKVISQTFYVKNNIAIDLTNFSLISIPKQ